MTRDTHHAVAVAGLVPGLENRYGHDTIIDIQQMSATGLCLPDAQQDTTEAGYCPSVVDLYAPVGNRRILSNGNATADILFCQHVENRIVRDNQGITPRNGCVVRIADVQVIRL